MTCKSRKCQRDIPDDAAYCLYCGTKQQRTPSRRLRANGMGTARKRGNTWTAIATIGWRKVEVDGKTTLVPIRPTKGGFLTKTAVLEYVPKLSKRVISKDGITFVDYWEMFRRQWVDQAFAS